MEYLEKYMETIVSLSVQYGSKLLLALFVLMFGWWLIARLISLIDVAMDKHAVEQTLQRFVISFINIALKAVLLVAFASMIGVETASLLALLGAAGLAVGLALQGSLANFSGGVIILFFRRFKAGDVIEVQGYIGVVYEIQMFNTVVTTLDNQRVYIPNGLLSNGCVKNIFVEPTRRVDMVFGISYEDDLLKAKSVIKTVLDSNELVLKDPEADVYVSAHADSSINFTVRPWCQSENYWAVYFSVHEKIKLAFDESNITIPFPQRDVHLVSQVDG